MNTSKIFVIIGLVMIIATLASAQNDGELKAYIVDLEYVDGEVEIDSVIVSTVLSVNDEIVGDYKLDIASFDDEVLYTVRFDFPTEIAFSPPPPGTFDDTGKQITIPEAKPQETEQQEQFLTELFIPYFANGKEIKVYDINDVLVAEESVAHFADLCGDNVCQDFESYESCQVDCVSGSTDDYCDGVADGICDVDCSGVEDDVDCVVEDVVVQDSEEVVTTEEVGEDEVDSDSSNVMLFSLLAVIGVLVLGIVVFLKMRSGGSGDSGAVHQQQQSPDNLMP
jgi:hypothetical protein